MEYKTISHAQALRIIGQKLDELGTTYFRICKEDRDYTVLTHPSVSAQLPVGGQAFRNIPTGNFLRHQGFSTEFAKCLQFSVADIPKFDVQARLKRRHEAGMIDVRQLSSSLRILGAYLDRKQADDFMISWFIDSVVIAIHKKEHTFSVHQNLYDLGIPMYLNRSHNIEDARKVMAT